MCLWRISIILIKLANGLMQGNNMHWQVYYRYLHFYLKIKMYVSLPTPYLTWVFSPTPWLRTPPVSLTYLTDLYLSHSGIPVKHPGFNPNIMNEPVEGEIWKYCFMLWYKKMIIICMIYNLYTISLNSWEDNIKL